MALMQCFTGRTRGRKPTKGYVATIELDDQAGLFHGEVINTRDVLTFEGRTLDELKTAFADTIGDHVEWGRKRGKQPKWPYSGNFAVRISPELHRRTTTAAAWSGKSVNTFIAETLEGSV
jgi:predicted HicB family RNase H-like nuclease